MTAANNAQIEKAIKSGVTEHRPKSVRLNKGHREDILNSVMKAWEANNPAPEGATNKGLITNLFKEHGKAKKGVKPEFRALARMVEHTELAKEFMTTVPKQLTEAVSLTMTNSIQIQIMDESTGDVTYFKALPLPLELLEELGIPVVASTVRNDHYNSVAASDWSEYSEAFNDGRGHKLVCARLVSTGGNNPTILIPAKGKVHKAYTEAASKMRGWEKEYKQMRDEVSDYLDQFNTTGQIRDNWPELIQHLPAHLADPEKVINLPALTVSRLNERLGLK